ncbi:hypothetical protein EDL96_00845 [Kocuria soli]|uniref:Pyruvate kinase n=1 Tax=Kocuria soli TaxID=2485125 RepID=A0A3N3ZTN0_9MICC|nr:pyruvate kinase [Kocuria soli]ROZ65671.1 hypothetical protein EDL96_00845 [Kocuria soli]
MIGCSLPEAFDDAEVGQRVLIDDGKLGTVIRSVDPDRMVVEVTRCRPGGVKLKAEKGLNFPDTSLRLSALSPQDREKLPFVAEHADILQLSFARSPQDIDDLLEALARIQGAEIDVVLKIETVSGFQSLPQMLLRMLGRTGCAVMIARGDLAVEAGFERLVELQEEIIWLCEAARVPVVWATQVLESQARSGLPSRAEVTDAGAGQRAECVMLNKGPSFLEPSRPLTRSWDGWTATCPRRPTCCAAWSPGIRNSASREPPSGLIVSAVAWFPASRSCGETTVRVVLTDQVIPRRGVLRGS